MLKKLSIQEKAQLETNSAFAVFDDHRFDKIMDSEVFSHGCRSSIPGGKTRADSNNFMSDMVPERFNMGAHSLQSVKNQSNKMREMSHDVNRRGSFFSSTPKTKSKLGTSSTKGTGVRTSKKCSSRAKSGSVRSSCDTISNSSKSTKSKRISKSKGKQPFPKKPEKQNTRTKS